MKKIVKFMVMISLSACMGCSDWLDVNPRTEVKEDQLYETEDGFKSALTGAYIQVASANLYGKNTSLYFPELLIQTWSPGGDTYNHPLEAYIPKWDFKQKDVEPFLETMYKSYYKCIAHLNNVLGNLDSHGAVFMHGNYDLIKGEALGLRAFLHLDLLRFFGPVPGPEASGQPAIPYVEEMTKNPNLLTTLTYDEVVRKIIRDLDAAEKCLANDPLLTSDNKHLNKPNANWSDWENKPEDEWHMYRQVRFNYYAVKGTKARLYHWIGETGKAIENAKEVIDSEKFRLTNENDYMSDYNGYVQNMVMLSEHLFGVSNPDHQSIIQSLFKNSDALLSQSTANISNAYEGITGDIRNVPNRYWQERSYQNNKTHHFRKYSGIDNIPTQNIIPLLRLAEMYLILIEDLPAGQKESYYRDYLIARNLPLEWENTLNDELKERLEKEYRKEFMGEGQMFFFYKKHNYEQFTWPSAIKVPANGYVIPRPQSQNVFD